MELPFANPVRGMRAVRWRCSGMPWAMPRSILCFLAGALITLWTWSAAQQEIHRVGRERFHFKAAEAQDAVRQRLLAYEQVLRGAAAFVTANGELSRAQWRTYVDRLDLQRQFPGIQAMAYAPIVPGAKRAAYIHKVVQEGFPGFEIKPAGARGEYVPVTYIEPFDWRNRRAFGFDLGAEHVRRAALMLARDLGAPAATGIIILKQETSHGAQKGFLMCAPLYPGGAAPLTLPARRANIVGYVTGVFRVNDLMFGIFGQHASQTVRLEIFDGKKFEAAGLIYESAPSAPQGSHPAAFVEEKYFEFGGRSWALRVSSTAKFDETIDAQSPRLILFGGILVSALFAGIVWSAGHNRRRALQIAAVNRDLEQLARDLERAKSAAEAASQAKGDFLDNVSHELRTPLTLILAPLEQLNAMAQPPADWRSHIERMTRNALILLNRVNDILDYSKAEAGKFEVHLETVALGSMLAPLLDDAAAVATCSGRTFTWAVDSALDSVSVDSRHLEKILLNLISNALKFTPGGGRINVAVAPFDSASYELSVADSGCGIAAAQLPELFSRFHQVDSSATRQHGGSGIGLALVKQLVQLMGGEVGVQSAVGQGTRFFVRLPYAPAGDAAMPSVQEGVAGQATGSGCALQRARFDEAVGACAPAAALAAAAAPNRARLLVADDNADMCALIVELLAEDYSVTPAADGLIAWGLLQRQPFDLVISDVMMPGLDGLGLTARIKADPSLARLPVILVTARGGADASTTGLACGANDYIAKPFSQRELKARVQAALRMAALQAQLREASRESGMAMLASGILHNVGNLLCDVTVSAELVHNIVYRSDAGKLAQVADMLHRAKQAPDTLPSELPAYVVQLAQRLQQERASVLAEAQGLLDGVRHAAAIIAAQLQHAGAGAEFIELVSVGDLLDTALALSKNNLAQIGVAIMRPEHPDAVVLVDRYKALQILLNLMANAADALEVLPPTRRHISISVQRFASHVRIEVADSGTGIDPQNIPLLFNQGFTTKGSGRGFGLHLSSVWAHDMGGVLACCSNGPGGASFSLQLPSPRLNDAESPDAAAVAAS